MTLPRTSLCLSLACLAACTGEVRRPCPPSGPVCETPCTAGSVRCGASTVEHCVEVGLCRDGERQCVQGVWSDCAWAVGPTAEACDGEDNDCNSAADDGLGALLCPIQEGVCAGSTAVCEGVLGLTCGESAYTTHAQAQSLVFEPAGETLCDGQDNDCDGSVDPMRVSDDATLISNADHGYSAAADAEANVYITGYYTEDISLGGGTHTSVLASADIFLASYTAAGAFRWSKSFGANRSTNSEGGCDTGAVDKMSNGHLSEDQRSFHREAVAPTHPRARRRRQGGPPTSDPRCRRRLAQP